jgi:hypothetical protein
MLFEAEVVDAKSSFLPFVRCTCADGMINNEELVEGMDNINVRRGDITARNIVKAIEMANSNSPNAFEKRNCLALLSGVVDFNEISSGVFTTNVCNGAIKPLPVKDKAMNKPEEFDKWKMLLREEVAVFRRPNLFFDNNGRFNIKTAYALNKNEARHWDRFHTLSKSIDIPEHVFVSSAALLHLLRSSAEVSAVFVDPSVHLRDGEARDRDQNLMFHISDDDREYEFSKSKACVDGTHPYWALARKCNNPASPDCCKRNI